MTVLNGVTMMLLVMAGTAAWAAWVYDGRAKRELGRIETANPSVPADEISRLRRSREGYLILKRHHLILAVGFLVFAIIYRMYAG